MLRSSRIKQVLQERKPLAERVKQVDNSIAHLSSQLTVIKDACDRANKLTSVRKKSTLNIIKSKCDKLLADIKAFRERARALRTRLERRTINVGAIGSIGAGKSTLLQVITGLDGTVIPATHGTGSFTSTKSVIAHHENGEMAEVTFYSEKELLTDVLQPFLMKLSTTKQIMLTSFDDFLKLTLPSSVSDEERPTLLELQKYQDPERVKIYQPLLDQPPKLLDDVKEVSRYLTYWIPESPKPELSASAARKPLAQQSKWMATREVRIKCKFKADDVGEIALIDMPGFGDKQAGNEERLVRALEEDVDLALYVYRPAPHRDGWEKSGAPQHFQVAKRALNGQLPFKEWSFVLLNHVKSDNAKQDTYEICNEMAEKMYDAGVEALSALVCDVTNPRDVRERVLDPILNYLAENISRMDLHFAQEIQRDANELQRVLSSELGELRRLCNSVFEDTDETELLARKSSELWEQLKESLVTRLYHSVWPAKDDDDVEYLQLVKRCVAVAENETTDPASLRRLALDGSTRQAALHVLAEAKLVEQSIEAALDAFEFECEPVHFRFAIS